MGLGNIGIPPYRMLMLKRAPPAVRALNPRVRAVWPFAWLWADAAGGHIIGKTHSRHVLLQGQLIRLICKLQRVEIIRRGGLVARRIEAGPVGLLPAATPRPAGRPRQRLSPVAVRG